MSPAARRAGARWIAATTAGELVAYGLVAGAGAALTPLVAAEGPAADGIVAAGTLAMGLLEGLLLGVAQWLALRAAGPVPAGRFIGATVLAMTVAWALGLWASYLAPPDVPGLVSLLVQGAGGGAVLGALLGLAQTAALRSAGLVPLRFVPASVAGWSLGLVLSAALASVLPEGPHTPVTALAAMGSGALTGLVVGTVMAPFVGRMVAAAPGA